MTLIETLNSFDKKLEEARNMVKYLTEKRREERAAIMGLLNAYAPKLVEKIKEGKIEGEELQSLQSDVRRAVIAIQI